MIRRQIIKQDVVCFRLRQQGVGVGDAVDGFTGARGWDGLEQEVVENSSTPFEHLPSGVDLEQ